MKIYTRTGDTGQTQVYADQVLKKDKDDSLLQCYGTLDELNSNLGLMAALASQETQAIAHQVQALQAIQQDIFAMGFAMSNASQLRTDAVEWLETHIDVMTETLPAQTRFILPGGAVIAAHAHVARTIARRAERELVTLSKHTELAPLVLQYINRLSDFLFVFARWCNAQLSTPDIEI